VRSQFGFHIIKVVDKKAATTRPFEEVRPQLEEQLKAERTDQQLAARAAELADRIDDPADLDTVGKETGFPVTESGLFERDDPVPGLGVAPQVATAAFQLEQGAVSEPITSPRGPVFITVTDVQDPYVPQLDEVRDRVREDAIRARATELSRQRASQVAASLRSAANFAAAAKAQGFEAKETELIPRQSPLPDIGISPEIDKVAFTLPVGGVSDPITTSDGTAIVRVVERDEVTPDELKQGKEAFRAELLNERRGRFFTAYMTKAKGRMRIEVNDDVVGRTITPTT
jgi:peptidyl-prolyl cis-trans isomerase D